MKIKYFLFKNRTYFLVVILLIVIFLLVFFFVKPALKELDNNAVLIQKKKLDIQVKNNKISKIPELKKKFYVVNANKEKLDVLFVKDNIVNLVKELESMAEDTNNEISIKIPEEKNKNTQKNLKKKNNEEYDLMEGFTDDDYFKLQINLVGNYESLLRFIYKLNNMRYYAKIVSFNILVDEISIKQNDAKNKKNVNPGLFKQAIVGSGDNNNFDNIDEKQKILKTNLDVIFYLKK